MNALQQLIQQHMTEHRLSYGEIARRGGLPRSTVHHLATTERLTRPPQPATMERLAKGLGLPVESVRAAAAAAAGYRAWQEPTTDPEIDVMVAGLKRLSPAQRRHVQALIHSLLDGH